MTPDQVKMIVVEVLTAVLLKHAQAGRHELNRTDTATALAAISKEAFSRLESTPPGAGVSALL